MTDEQLDEALREFVSREVHVDFQDWTTAILRLPRSVRVYYFSWLLEAEVCNGGFIHFFLNFWGQLGSEGASCFEELGSPELAAVIRRAVAIFWNEVGTGRFADKQAYEVEEAVKPLLRPLDDEFYSLEVDTDELRLRCLRAHAAQFADYIANGTLGAGTTDASAVQGDLAAFQGRWELISQKRDGIETKSGPCFYVVEGATMIAQPRGHPAVRYSLELDASADPKRMDIIFTNEAGESAIGEAIYELEGDSLRWCHVDGKRPALFVSEENPQGTLVVCRRAKAKGDT